MLALQSCLSLSVSHIWFRVHAVNHQIFVRTTVFNSRWYVIVEFIATLLFKSYLSRTISKVKKMSYDTKDKVAALAVEKYEQLVHLFHNHSLYLLTLSISSSELAAVRVLSGCQYVP
jgi:hypothetical protein